MREKNWNSLFVVGGCFVCIFHIKKTRDEWKREYCGLSNALEMRS